MQRNVSFLSKPQELEKLKKNKRRSNANPVYVAVERQYMKSTYENPYLEK